MALPARELFSQPEVASVLIDSLHSGVLLLDESGSVQAANPAARRFFESRSEPIVGLPISSLFEEESPVGTPITPPEMRDGEQLRTEAVGRSESGVFLTAALSWSRIHTESGTRTVVVIEDTGPARQAAAALRAGQTLFRDHVENNPGAVVIHGLDGRIRYVNDAACRLIERTMGDLIGRNVTEFVVPEDVSSLLTHLAALESREPVDAITRIVTGRGAIRGMMFRSFLADDADGGEPYVICHGSDVTERLEAERAVRAAHEQAEEVLNAIAAVLIGVDADGIVHRWSAAAGRCFGVSADAALGQPLAALGLGWDFAVVDEAVAEAQQTRATPSVRDVSYRRPDRTEAVLSLAVTPVFDADGRSRGVLFLGADVTERRAIEQAFAASEARMRAVLDAAVDAIITIDAKGTIVSFNPAAARMFDRNAADVIGQSAAILVSEADRARYEPQFLRHARGESVAGLGGAHELCARKRDGSTLPVELVASTFETDGRRVFVGILRDLSERKRVESALQESEQRLRSALDAAELGTWEWDLASGDVTWGGHHAAMFGLALDEFDGRFESFLALVHADDRPVVERRVAESRDQHGTFEHEYRVVWPDGSVHWVHGRGVFVYDDEGVAVRMIGAVTEVTQRRALEQQLLQAQKLESIGQLAAGIAHEINTPTQYVGDNVRFLQSSFRDLWQLIGAYQNLGETARAEGVIAPKLLDDLDALATEVDLEFLVGEIPRAVEQCLEGVERVSTIVAAMKDFSHPSSEEKKPIDLNRALASTATVARNEWKYVARLETEFDPALPPVPCHAGQLNQVFLNLIVNAAHAIESVHKQTGELGTIRLVTRSTPTGVEVRIADSGSGIPPEIRDRVFLPFFTTKGVGKGTGQGLSMARATVVDQHGGTLHFEDTPGGGTTFVVSLPIAPVAAEAGK